MEYNDYEECTVPDDGHVWSKHVFLHKTNTLKIEEWCVKVMTKTNMKI